MHVHGRVNLNVEYDFLENIDGGDTTTGWVYEQSQLSPSKLLSDRTSVSNILIELRWITNRPTNESKTYYRNYSFERSSNRSEYVFDGGSGQEKMTEGMKNAGKGIREVGKGDGTRAKEEERGGISGLPDRAKFGHGSVCV